MGIAGKGHLQVLVHFLEGLLGLGEEVVDDGFGELTLLFVIVHFKDLERREEFLVSICHE